MRRWPLKWKRQRRIWSRRWRKQAVVSTICNSDSMLTWGCWLTTSTLPAPSPTPQSRALRFYDNSFGVCVCVSWGGRWSVSVLSRVMSCIFWLVSWRHCLQISFTWIYSDLSEVSTRNGMHHPNYVWLAVQPWPQTPQVEIDEPQVPHPGYPEDQSWVPLTGCIMMWVSSDDPYFTRHNISSTYNNLWRFVGPIDWDAL